MFLLRTLFFFNLNHIIKVISVASQWPCDGILYNKSKPGWICIDYYNIDSFATNCMTEGPYNNCCGQYCGPPIGNMDVASCCFR